MNLKVFLASLVFILVVDFLWLGLIATNFYTTRLTEVGRFEDGKLKIVYWSALMVYLLLALGITVFVLPLTAASDSMLGSFVYGALFGFITYGVYDFTNHATLKSWPISLLTADVLWGSFVCASASCVEGGESNGVSSNCHSG